MAVALGLSLMTAAPLVMAAAGFLCTGLWARRGQSEEAVEATRSLAIVRECELLAAVVLSLAVLGVGRGALSL